MAAWIRTVDLALAEAKLGKAQVERSLAEARGYAQPPRLDSAGRVHATVTRAATTSGVQVGREERTDVVVRVVGSVEASCSCPARGRFLCEHVTAVVVDLAVSADLRDALANGGDARDAVLALPASRRALVEERTLDERLARWLPPPFDGELEVDVEPSRPLGAARTDERPLLLLRFRRAATREAVAPRALLEARLAPRDQRLVELLAPSVHRKDALAATRAQASLALDLLSRDLRVRTGGFKKPARFERAPVTLRVDADGDRLVARFATVDGRVVIDAADALLFAGPKPFVFSVVDERFHPVDPSVDLDVAWGLTSVPSLPLNERTRERIGRTLLGRARGAGIALPAPDAFGLPPLERPSFQLRLEGSKLEVRGRLEAVYAGGTTFPVDAASLKDERAAEDGRHVTMEAEALARVLAAGFEEEGAALVAEDERAVRFWRDEAPALTKGEPPIAILTAPSLAGTSTFATVDAQVRASTESGWLEVNVAFSASMVKVELAAIRRALAAGRRWVSLEDGTLARIQEEVAALVGELDGAADDGHLRLPARQIGRVDRWLTRFEGGDHPSLAAVRTRLRDLASGAPREADAPASVQATLRPYQRRALGWLEDLAALGAGAILADDMGLGKTLVTLAFIARRRADGAKGPALVVCPTSVLGNWAAETARFVPSLRVVTWRSGSPPVEAFAEADLVLTTYGLLRRHAEALPTTTKPSLLVLDEAQFVKNADADTARAARAVDAPMRVALTGTPVENRLDELWSILDVVEPGLLGTRADFDRTFASPLAVTPGGAVAARLRALVRPFVLRRTKAEVLDDLPPKTEIDRVCVLGLRQKRLYDALAIALREAVKKDLRKRGNAPNRIAVLTAILRLRQMACDPRLVDPTVEASASAKREAFLDVVRELVAEGRRALVFSQFVELLTLWREDLDRDGIRYAYLDGSSTDRDAIVAGFQRGDAPLFLVSLKAGGVGMNLTAADTVVFCDPWWNPAVEAQAEDRAHRPGQTKPVTVIRLVAEGTIEEKVRLMKDHKRALASAVLDPDAPSEALPLTDDDLALLFDDVDGDDAPEDAPVARARGRFVANARLDAIREVVRGLEETGLERRTLAKATRIPAAQLALLRQGHRIRLTEEAAARIEELAARRRGPWCD